MENSLDFARTVVVLVAEMVEKQGLTHTEFGRSVFGEESGVRVWRKCRNAEDTRQLSLAETYKVAEFFGIDIGTMLWTFSKEWEFRKGN